MPVYPTPEDAVYGKLSSGLTDTTISNGVYKFMGCTVLSLNMSIGFNSTPSSLTVTLVEDSDDEFVEPDLPSLHAFSLPKGGVGAKIIYTTPISLTPNAFEPTNVPF